MYVVETLYVLKIYIATSREIRASLRIILGTM